MLDKVQKQKSVSGDEFKYLKKLKLIEGRKNNIYLSAKVIEPINDEELKAEYIANKSFDDNHFKDMIVGYLKKFGKTKRSALDNLVIPKLSAILSDVQKKKKVDNFLLSLRTSGKIKTAGYGVWVLT